MLEGGPLFFNEFRMGAIKALRETASACPKMSRIG